MNKNENVDKDKILKYVNEFDYKNGLDLVRNVRLIKHTRNGYEHTFEFNVMIIIHILETLVFK